MNTDSLNRLVPTLKCDVVIKGGITSGGVYPRAVLALSKKYRLMNIGGASAGAIAAAGAAAAEFGRHNGTSKVSRGWPTSCRGSESA